MEKIYGYKEKDILGLAEFISKKQGGTLTNAFSEYAMSSGKAQGTIRNLYYALAKKSCMDSEFCNKYLSGKQLSVGKIVEFDQAEEENLATSIIKEKLKGRSVRSVILELAGGDQKKALRYQNKYRNLLKNNPALIDKITENLAGKDYNAVCSKNKEREISYKTSKIKNQINSLIDKITSEAKKESQKLKVKLDILESENLRLRCELTATSSPDGAVRYFMQNNASAVKV